MAAGAAGVLVADSQGGGAKMMTLVRGGAPLHALEEARPIPVASLLKIDADAVRKALAAAGGAGAVLVSMHF